MSWTERRAAFRRLLAGPGCILPASVFDPVSARLAEAAGFEAGMLAGSTAALTIAAAPDTTVITATELAEQALRINRAAGLPLIVDADHGYGNAGNVARTVESLEIAGVAALTIEDTALPVPFDPAAARYIPLDEALDKLRAALGARRDGSAASGLAVVGRTTLDVRSPMEAVLDKLRAFAGVGVDAFFVSGVRTEAELLALAEAATVPLMLGSTPLATPANLGLLARHGVRVALQGHLPLRAAVEALRRAYLALRDGGEPMPPLASDTIMRRLTW